MFRLVSWAPTLLAKKPITPSAFSCPAMPTNTANQNRVSQAGGYVRQSFHVSTPVISNTDRPIMAATTALMPTASPATQRARAKPMVASMIFSSRLMAPILSSFSIACRGASGVSLISGGASLYRIAGVMARPMAAGTTAAVNHVSHGLAIWTPSSAASFIHSRFCAAAVRNMALLLTLPWNCDMTRKLPSFLLLGSLGLLPAARDREFMMGMKMPPARAVVDGMAGAISASATDSP
mmetsp:Transcript_14037/g.42362  ORF Transcript_14037/g.42362 Transcript_14037/m.42362 type:complete len:237 (+) Transcript_14037:3050-3760(+)